MKKVLVKATTFFISPVHGNVKEGDRLEVSEAFAAHLVEHNQAVRVNAPAKVDPQPSELPVADDAAPKAGILQRIAGKIGKSDK